MSKSLEKLTCSVYTIYVNMNGNEVLPRLLSKPLLLMTSVFEQGHWLFLCDVLCAEIPDSAMGGGTEVSKVDDALAAVDDLILSKLG